MSRRAYDPLSHIPSADVVEQVLRESETKTARLRILYRVAREIEQAARDADRRVASAEGASHAE